MSIGLKLRRAVATIALTITTGSVLVDTSCTPAPQCPSGQHAARADSHQGSTWQCVPDSSS